MKVFVSSKRLGHPVDSVHMWFLSNQSHNLYTCNYVSNDLYRHRIDMAIVVHMTLKKRKALTCFDCFIIIIVL